jgi:RepB DNA-primase from phage plasmid
VIWRVEGLHQGQAEALLRLLATQFRGDIAATDVCRVLRVPGFTNRKYNEQFLVRAVQETDQIYHLGDFAVHEDSPDAPRHTDGGHEPTRRMPSGHRSQSEADWAYAKRALARGDSPEEIIRRIADYRSEDKADPHYYARLTVNKAQSQLAVQNAALPDAHHESERTLDATPTNSRSSREV